MKIIIELDLEEKPRSCMGCPFAQWEYSWVTCLLTKKAQEDTGKSNFKIKGCPIKGGMKK